MHSSGGKSISLFSLGIKIIQSGNDSICPLLLTLLRRTVNIPLSKPNTSWFRTMNLADPG